MRDNICFCYTSCTSLWILRGNHPQIDLSDRMHNYKLSHNDRLRRLALILQANELLIKPAVFGVENVLTSALDTPSLEKVVVTSSVGAVVGSKKKLSQHHLHDEADWNEEAAEDFQPYSRSALLSLKS